MKSFYSILRVPVKPAGQEQLNIGLLLVGENDIHFTYSPEKLALLKKLLPVPAFNLLRTYVLGLTSKINTEVDQLRDRFYRSDFVEYLANYNSNLVVFTRPSAIDIEVNIDSFRKLFEKFVFIYHDEYETNVEDSKVTVRTYLQHNLYPKIEDRVNINQQITTRDIPTLMIPSVKVDFIGTNRKPVVGFGVDFEKSEATISNQISKFISLIKAFDDQATSGKYFLIGKEPDRDAYSEQHANWEQIKESKSIELIDLSEVEKVTEYVLSHNVRPFIGV